MSNTVSWRSNSPTTASRSRKTAAAAMKRSGSGSDSSSQRRRDHSRGSASTAAGRALVPPPKPSDNAAQIAAFYRDNTDRIRVGMLMSMVATALLAPFIILITQQMKRRNPRLALLADIQLLCGFALLIMILIPITFIALGAFRPERPPESTQLLNDIAFFALFWVFSTPVLEYLSMAAYSLMDRSDRPLFPRWFGSFDLVTAAVFLTAPPPLLLKDPPF